MKTRVPFSESYVRFVGIAVYLFSYYEWQIIYIVDELAPGFVREYSRQKTLTSRAVHDRFDAVLSHSGARNAGLHKSLACCRETFDSLIARRNALIHAHPITDPVEGQILHYQTKPSKPISDMRWEPDQIRGFIVDVDEAACEANALFYRLKGASGAKSPTCADEQGSPR